jgi:drug/metabolite transporter (DMT)-like permease
MSGGSVLRLSALAMLWGSSFLFIKVSLDGLSPVQIVLVRMCTGALVLCAFLAIRNEALPRQRVIWAHIVVASIIANIIPYLLFAWGEQHVDSAIAGALNATTPLFTVAIALALRTEKMMNSTRAAGLVLGFIGAILIVAPWKNLSGTATGALACLAAAASYGIAYVYMQRYLIGRGLSPLVLATAQITAGALILVAGAPLVARQDVQLTTPVITSVLALGGLGTGLAYILNYRLIQDEGATTASTVTYLLPIVAVVLGAIILGEPITWHLFVGTIMVLAGIALSDRRSSPPPAQSARLDNAAASRGNAPRGSRHSGPGAP